MRRRAAGGRGGRDPSRPARLLSTEQVEEALARVAEASRGAPLALAGGVAMAWYGSDRLTGDVDLLARRVLRQRAGVKAGRTLSFGGRSYLVWGVGRSGATVPVDVIVRSDEWRSLYREALSRAIAVPGLPRGVLVVRPEHLLAMKMVAGRPKDELDAMYLASMPRLDFAEARRVVRRHLGAYALGDLEQLRVLGQWERSRH